MILVVAVTYVLAFSAFALAWSMRADPKTQRLLAAGSDLRPLASSRLRSRAWRRPPTASRVLRSSVAELLDVLAVSVTAGLTPRLALDRSPESLAGPWVTVLTDMRNEVSLGTAWPRVLEAGAKRFEVDELRRLAIVIRRAERLGAPVAERLRELASEVRQERRVEREERARRAPVRMLFPLVFLILPAFVLAAVVPAVLVAIRDLG